MEYAMNSDFVDGFAVTFTKENSIIHRQAQPLGHYAMRALRDYSSLGDLHRFVENFDEEFLAFLCARDVSSAAVVQQKLNELWELLGQLPVYDVLYPEEKENAQELLHYMREHPDKVDDMVTPGTDRNRMMTEWLRKLRKLPEQMQRFYISTTRLLSDFFSELESYKPSDYARAYGKYYAVTIDALRNEENPEQFEFATEFRSLLPVEFSYVPVQKDGEIVLAERMSFTDLPSFLQVDFFRGLMAGNAPRRCQNCGEYFLAMGGYDTRYCNNIAPGELDRTCRKVGAHRTEKLKNQNLPILKEYARVYNRLKARKRNRKLSEAEWNQQVAEIQVLKEKALRGEYSDAELKLIFDKI